MNQLKHCHCGGIQKEKTKKNKTLQNNEDKYNYKITLNIIGILIINSFIEMVI